VNKFLFFLTVLNVVVIVVVAKLLLPLFTPKKYENVPYAKYREEYAHTIRKPLSEKYRAYSMDQDERDYTIYQK